MKTAMMTRVPRSVNVRRRRVVGRRPGADNPGVDATTMATQRSRTVGVTKGASGTCALVCMAVMVGACREAVPLPVDLVQVEMTAHKADWKAAYQLANADGTVRAIDTGREVHVPIGSTVTLMMTSAEYIATFDAPGLGLRDFAEIGRAHV